MSVEAKKQKFHKEHVIVWIPREVHKSLKAAAATQGKSIKEYIVEVIKKDKAHENIHLPGRNL